MSSTICLELERYDTTVRHGAWEEPRIMRTWLYPDDTDTFRETLDGLDHAAKSCEGDDRDIYETDDYAKLLDDIAHTTEKDTFPPAPEDWEHAGATITILY